MEVFTRLFGDLLVFVYHCFDRIVINGYLTNLSRPEHVVYFFRQVLGIPVVSKEVLSQRTSGYRAWVEAFARNHGLPIEWAEKGVRKEDYVLPALRRMEKKNSFGVYFIFRSMEQGRTFRISMPKFPTQDPDHRILAHQTSRFTHFYFYVRDEALGPIVIRVASFFPFHATYYLNGHSFMERELTRRKIGFRKDDNAFLAVDDVAALQAAADRLSPTIIRKQLDYWTHLLGPKFSKKERSEMGLSRFYSITQIEYCRNFIFKRHFPIHKIFEFQQSARLRPEKGARSSRGRPRKVQDHYGSLRRFPGPVPQRPRGLSTPPADRLARYYRLSPLSRHQNPRHPDNPATGGFASRRQYCRRLDCPTDPRSRTGHVSASRQKLWSEPASLRSAQTERP
jgi:hypothetical protein